MKDIISLQVLLVMSMVFLVTSADDNLEAKLKKAKTDLVGMNQLIETIKSDEFDLQFGQLNNFLSPAISMVTSVLSYLKDSRRNDSEVNEIRYSYNLANNALNTKLNNFDLVRDKIDWSVIQVTFGIYEKSIRSALLNLDQVIEAPYRAQNFAIQYFLTKYESDFGNAGSKIFDSIINEGIFVTNIILAARKFTQEYRKKVQVFGKGLTQLIFQAIEVEMAYSDLKYNNSDHTQFIDGTWKRRVESIKKKLVDEDIEVKNAFSKQHEIDRDVVLSANSNLPNYDFVGVLFDFLREKYYWKVFFVVAYKPISDYNEHAHLQCGGSSSFRRYNRNLIYASQDIEESEFDLETAQNAINSIQVRGHTASDVLNALQQVTRSDCTSYTFRGVICWGCSVEAVHYESQAVYRKICTKGSSNCFNVFLSG